MPTFTYERLGPKGEPTGQTREFFIAAGKPRPETMRRDGERWKRRFDLDLATVAPAAPPGAYPRCMWNYACTPDRVEEYQKANPHLRYKANGLCYADSASDLRAAVKAKGHEDLTDTYNTAPKKGRGKKLTSRARGALH